MRIITGGEAARSSLLKRSTSRDADLPPAVRETIRRVFGAELDVAAVVDRILLDVRREGDEAVRRYNREIDGVKFAGPLEVSKDELRAAYDAVEPELVEALRFAASRIEKFHRLQLQHSMRSFEEGGLGQIVRPLRRVGMYVPGNKAVYPSTVLMTAVPARVAGVAELVMTTPVGAEGRASPLKLVAADIAGVHRVFRAGGVQAVGAMAYGTESIPRVDKICGPGNIFVTAAKKRVYGEVGIDGVFGPSETVVVADERAEASMVVADLLAGAEHDELATAVLITNSQPLAEEASRLIEEEIALIERREIARASLAVRGAAVVVGSVQEALALAAEFAPEHLCVHLADPDVATRMEINAGCLFLGAFSVESIGDYTAGPSHVMPTGGSAAFASPLGVHDFLKATTVVRLDERTANEVGPAAAAIARAEGLTAHASAVERRLRGGRAG